MFAYCGLDCKKCPIFVATSNNDEATRQTLADEFSKAFKSEDLADILDKIHRNTRTLGNLRPEDMNCKGCRSESNVYIGCMSCRIRECCLKNSLPTCASCEEYETCNLLKCFYSISAFQQQAKDNLERIV